MQINKIEFFRSIYVEESPLRISAPLVAMVGRSNVGKSSLINYLSGNKKIAKVSKEPGKTRSINYYKCNDGDFYLVDLPGYGYAKVSKAMKATWSIIIEDFFSSSNKHIVLMIIDARRDITENDRIMYEYIYEKRIPHTIALSKCDYISKSQLSNVVQKMANSLHIGVDNVFPFSSRANVGRDNLLKRVSTQIEAIK